MRQRRKEVKEWYTKMMIEAHNNKRWEDRNNYAKLASVDFVKYFYLKE